MQSAMSAQLLQEELRFSIRLNKGSLPFQLLADQKWMSFGPNPKLPGALTWRLIASLQAPSGRPGPQARPRARQMVDGTYLVFQASTFHRHEKSGWEGEAAIIRYEVCLVQIRPSVPDCQGRGPAGVQCSFRGLELATLP